LFISDEICSEEKASVFPNLFKFSSSLKQFKLLIAGIFPLGGILFLILTITISQQGSIFRQEVLPFPGLNEGHLVK